MKDYSDLNLGNLSKQEESQIALQMHKAFSDDEYVDFFEKLPTKIHPDGKREILLTRCIWQEAMNGSCAGAHVENIKFLKKFGFFNEALFDQKTNKYITDGAASEWLYHLFANYNDFSKQNVLDLIDELQKSGVRFDTFVKKMDLPGLQFDKNKKQAKITFFAALVFRGALEVFKRFESEIPINGFSLEIEKMSNEKLLSLALKDKTIKERSLFFIETSVFGKEVGTKIIKSFLDKNALCSTIAPLHGALTSNFGVKEQIIDWFISKKHLWKNSLHSDSLGVILLRSFLSKNSFFNVSEFEVFKKMVVHNDWVRQKEEVLSFLHSMIGERLNDVCIKTSCFNSIEMGNVFGAEVKKEEREFVVNKDKLLNISADARCAIKARAVSAQVVELSPQEMVALCILQGARLHCTAEEQEFFFSKNNKEVVEPARAGVVEVCKPCGDDNYGKLKNISDGFYLLLRNNLKKMVTLSKSWQLKKDDGQIKETDSMFLLKKCDDVFKIPGTKEVSTLLKVNNFSCEESDFSCEESDFSCEESGLFKYVEDCIKDGKNDLAAELLLVLFCAKEVGYFSASKSNFNDKAGAVARSIVRVSGEREAGVEYDKTARKLFEELILKVPKEILTVPISAFANHSLLHAFFILDDEKTIENVYKKYPDVLENKFLKEKTITHISVNKAQFQSHDFENPNQVGDMESDLSLGKSLGKGLAIDEIDNRHCVVSVGLEKAIKINGVLDLALHLNSTKVLSFVRKVMNEGMLVSKVGNELVLNDSFVHLLLEYSVKRMEEKNETNLIHQSFCREFLCELLSDFSFANSAKNKDGDDLLSVLSESEQERASMWWWANEIQNYDKFAEQMKCLIEGASIDLQIGINLKSDCVQNVKQGLCEEKDSKNVSVGKTRFL